MSNSPGWRRILVCFSLCVLSSGCASFADRVEAPLERAGKGDAHYLKNVPSVAQQSYQCGPAALESVIRYWGGRADAKEIARALLKPGSHGVLDFTLSEYARKRGFWTQIKTVSDTADGAAELKTWILRGIPPIVMLKTGIWWVPTYHFVVLKGFSGSDRLFYANVGKPETYAINNSQLRARWRGSDDWYLIICPPERVNWDLDEAESLDLGHFCERWAKLSLAEKWYARALEKNPSSRTAQFDLANVYLKSNRFEKAEVLYKALLKEKPDWSPPANNLAWIYLEEGHPQKALVVIEAVFKNGGERRPDILDTLARVRSEWNNVSSAESGVKKI